MPAPRPPAIALPRAARAASPPPRSARLVLLGLAVLLLALLTGGGGHGPRGAATAATTRHTETGAASSRSEAPRSARAAGYPESSEVRRLIALGHPIYCAPRRGNEVALTFDDGPGPYTRLMIDKLRKHHAGATFFIVGRNITLVPGATRAERALGAVGDHTFSHPLLTSLAPAKPKRRSFAASATSKPPRAAPCSCSARPTAATIRASTASRARTACSRSSGTSTAATRSAPTTRRSNAP